MNETNVENDKDVLEKIFEALEALKHPVALIGDDTLLTEEEAANGAECREMKSSNDQGYAISSFTVCIQRGFSMKVAMTATSIVRIGRPKMVIIAVAGISISFMIVLLLKGLIGGQTKGAPCYTFFYEAVLNGRS